MGRSSNNATQADKDIDFGGDTNPCVNETFWGYVIGPSDAARTRARRGETMAVFGALFFFGIAFLPWLLGTNSQNADLMPFRIAVTAVFFAIGGLMYLMAKKGMALETQVDLHEKEFRVVRRNRGQESVTLKSYGFDQIAEMQTSRAPGHFMLGNLVLRLSGGEAPVVIASGSEAALEHLKEKILVDMRPEAARTKRPQTFAVTARPEVERPSVFKRAIS